MAVGLYDDALTNKIKKWVKNPNLRVLKPDESTRYFEMTFDMTQDKPLTLPLIAISREKNVDILNTQKNQRTFDGVNLDSNEKISMPLNVIPIRIGYQLDIYTKGMQEADEYLRNFIFNFVNYPKLEIEIPYNNIKLKHLSTLYLESSITDNSDIKEHLFPDQFVRFTLRITVDDAYLFSAPTQPVAQIDGMCIQTRDISIRENV